MTIEQKSADDLATEAMVQSIPSPVPAPTTETPCADKDTACNRRWIEAYSDCA